MSIVRFRLQGAGSVAAQQPVRFRLTGAGSVDAQQPVRFRLTGAGSVGALIGFHTTGAATVAPFTGTGVHRTRGRTAT